MHCLRFDDFDIYITEKVMEYCGKFNIKSKKRVKWQILHKGQKHEIHCAISFSSGKKKVVHNGFVIQQIKDSSKALNAIVNIGEHKMVIMIDENSELIRPKIQMRSNIERSNEFKPFLKFKNIYCD